MVMVTTRFMVTKSTIIELKEKPQDYEVHSIRIITDGRTENGTVNYIGIDKDKNLVYVNFQDYPIR